MPLPNVTVSMKAEGLGPLAPAAATVTALRLYLPGILAPEELTVLVTGNFSFSPSIFSP